MGTPPALFPAAGVASVVSAVVTAHYALFPQRGRMLLRKRRGVAEDSEGRGGRAGVSP